MATPERWRETCGHVLFLVTSHCLHDLSQRNSVYFACICSLNAINLTNRWWWQPFLDNLSSKAFMMLHMESDKSSSEVEKLKPCRHFHVRTPGQSLRGWHFFPKLQKTVECNLWFWRWKGEGARISHTVRLSHKHLLCTRPKVPGHPWSCHVLSGQN